MTVKPKIRIQDVEPFPVALEEAIRKGLPPVKPNALVERARELVGEEVTDGKTQQASRRCHP